VLSGLLSLMIHVLHRSDSGNVTMVVVSTFSGFSGALMATLTGIDSKKPALNGGADKNASSARRRSVRQVVRSSGRVRHAPNLRAGNCVHKFKSPTLECEGWGTPRSDLSARSRTLRIPGDAAAEQQTSNPPT
jgi:hypothetical protein